MATFNVKQRARGTRRWAVVGSFATVASRTDRISVREELRAWLHSQGVAAPDMRIYCTVRVA